MLRFCVSRVLLICAIAFVNLSAATEESVSSEALVQTKIAWSDEESNCSELGNKQIIGMVELVHIEPGNIEIEARIDTGATKTSLGAKDLQIVNEDGQDWALFNVGDNNVRSKIVDYVLIKQHGRPSVRRPIIMLKVTLGNVTQVVKATLTDRSNFKYKLLVGVNYLTDHFVVDVSRKHVTKLQPEQ